MTENVMLRTKTKDMVARLDEESRSVLNTYIRTFLGWDEEVAFKEIVKIKLSPESIIDHRPEFWDTMIDEDVLSKICGDLTANYKENNPNCWLCIDEEEFPQDLKKDLSNDTTLLVLIRKRIAERFKSVVDLNRVEALLTSQEENKRFGGLRELGFTRKESDKFKNYTDSIWEFISSEFIPKYKEEEKEIEETVIPKELPKQSEETTPNYTADLVKYKDKIKELFDAANDAIKASTHLGKVWVEVEELGLDPEAILGKRLTILDLLNAMGAI